MTHLHLTQFITSRCMISNSSISRATDQGNKAETWQMCVCLLNMPLGEWLPYQQRPQLGLLGVSEECWLCVGEGGREEEGHTESQGKPAVMLKQLLVCLEPQGPPADVKSMAHQWVH